MTHKLPPSERHPIMHNSPSRVWEATGNYTEDGAPMYASREWRTGERAAYCREVLYREPHAGDVK